MINVYYASTPNGHKITLFLEETGVPYQLHRLDISAGNQFKPAFLAISPNNKIPVIVDNQPAGGGTPLSLFESGAILLYLVGKPASCCRTNCVNGTPPCSSSSGKWRDNGGVRPDAWPKPPLQPVRPGESALINRYRTETARLYGVLDKQLQNHRYIAGERYSISDIATCPWAVSHKKQDINLADYPAVQRWVNEIRTSPAVERAWRRANG